MRIKTTFSLLCLVMLLLSVGVVDIHAISCTSYFSTYLNKLELHNSALKTLDRVRVVVLKGTPYASVPPELAHLEGEYDSDPTGFYLTIQTMGVAIPGYVSGTLSLQQLVELRGALSDAEAAYDRAVTAYNTAKKAFEDCQGMTIVTIWCERGADCQEPPELS